MCVCVCVSVNTKHLSCAFTVDRLLIIRWCFRSRLSKNIIQSLRKLDFHSLWCWGRERNWWSWASILYIYLPENNWQLVNYTWEEAENMQGQLMSLSSQHLLTSFWTEEPELGRWEGVDNKLESITWWRGRRWKEFRILHQFLLVGHFPILYL